MSARRQARDQSIGQIFGRAIRLGSGILLGSGFAIALLSSVAIAQEPSEPRPYAPLRQPTSCPDDVATLTNVMMRDIPGYTNRVLQRTVAVLPHTEADALRAADSQLVRAPYRPSHVLVAGNVNLTPLDLSDYAFTTDPDAGGPLTQVFFTTLSRQYSGLQTKEVQEYHWLFLTKATDGWRLAFMFSQIDGSQLENASTPPEESSRGSLGQAVQLWLRDCRASAIAPLEEALPAPESPQRGLRPE